MKMEYIELLDTYLPFLCIILTFRSVLNLFIQRETGWNHPVWSWMWHLCCNCIIFSCLLICSYLIGTSKKSPCHRRQSPVWNGSVGPGGGQGGEYLPPMGLTHSGRTTPVHCCITGQNRCLEEGWARDPISSPALSLCPVTLWGTCHPSQAHASPVWGQRASPSDVTKEVGGAEAAWGPEF